MIRDRHKAITSIIWFNKISIDDTWLYISRSWSDYSQDNVSGRAVCKLQKEYNYLCKGNVRNIAKFLNYTQLNVDNACKYNSNTQTRCFATSTYAHRFKSKAAVSCQTSLNYDVCIHVKDKLLYAPPTRTRMHILRRRRFRRRVRDYESFLGSSFRVLSIF